MNRTKGTALLLTGLVALLASIAGVFALISDTADTGTLSVDSANQGSSTDLQVNDGSVADVATNECTNDTFVEDQTTPLLTLTDASVGDSLTRFVCVRNTGAQPAQISLELLNTTNLESNAGCTGDEADTDTTCDLLTDPGEIADDVDVVVTKRGVSASSSVACNEADQAGPVSYDGVADTAAQPLSDPIGPGQYACYRIVATYDAATPAAEVNENQSDVVSWQLRFHGEI